MDWMNYHHLYYFWIVAREGTISAAAERLDLARSTITSQLRELEKSFSGALFEKKGKRLALTELGRVVLGYAEEIFSLGQELREVAARGLPGKAMRLTVGIPDVIPKLIAFRLLQPALDLDKPVRLVCFEGKFDNLLADLAMHRLDLVLSDTPASPTVDVVAFNHKLGECGTTFFASRNLAKSARKGFPSSLADVPLLLPVEKTALRRALNQWLRRQEFVPNIAAEFEDSALMKVFGQSGLGVFPAPTAIEDEVRSQYTVEKVGQLDEVRDQFFAVTVEKRIQHEAVLAICETARSELFD